LRTSSATTAKPRPCSPARAASIAAFSASRFVWPAMPVIVSTMPPICSERAERLVIALSTAPEASRTACIVSDAFVAAAMPSSAAALAEPATPTLSSVDDLACATICTWRSAPCATSPTAFAISPTARPASSEVDAICAEAAATLVEPFRTVEIVSASLARIVL